MFASTISALGALGLVAGGFLGTAQAVAPAGSPAGPAPAAAAAQTYGSTVSPQLRADVTPAFGQTVLSPAVHGKTVLVAGDSWAYHMADGMLAAVPQGQDTIVDAGGGGCGIMLPTTPGTPPICNTWQSQWPLLMTRYHPDAVILEISEWDITPQQITAGGPMLNLTDPAYRARFVSNLDQAVNILTAHDTPLYLENSKMEGDKVFGPWATIMNEILREFAQNRPNVHLLDVRDQLCEDEVCPPQLDGVKVYDPTGHTTPDADRRLAVWALNTMFA
ncbi:MAG TPA: SGNH hydrolase domain-containing protein [Actinocrinis sp.]|nr:SGNH hydrolase domain-containing protein [Actinocrinis sp.]